jgi:hypothetical protein
MDIWKAGAPSLDFLSPDFYNPDFKYWNDLYTRTDNPLFVPEIKFEPGVEAKVFYTIGHYDGMGFSPFSIESTEHPDAEPLGKSYHILNQLSPVILDKQGKGVTDGVLLDKVNRSQDVKLGDYRFNVQHDYTLGWSPEAKKEEWPMSGAIIIAIAPNEYYVAGTGVVMTFKANSARQAGILEIEEGSFVDGKWKAGRRLNGDQNHQGRHIRIPAGEFGIQKVKLYEYE